MKQRFKKLRQRFKRRPNPRPQQRPNPLPRLYRWRTNLLQAPLFVLLTALCGSISLLVSLVDKKGNAQHRIARFWARAGVWNSGSKLKVVGTEKLDNNKPGVFFDATFSLAPELTRGKSNVTVKFAAHPGNIAGGVYGIRVLREGKNQ